MTILHLFLLSSNMIIGMMISLVTFLNLCLLKIRNMKCQLISLWHYDYKSLIVVYVVILLLDRKSSSNEFREESERKNEG